MESALEAAGASVVHGFGEERSRRWLSRPGSWFRATSALPEHIAVSVCRRARLLVCLCVWERERVWIGTHVLLSLPTVCRLLQLSSRVYNALWQLLLLLLDITPHGRSVSNPAAESEGESFYARCVCVWAVLCCWAAARERNTQRAYTRTHIHKQAQYHNRSFVRVCQWSKVCCVFLVISHNTVCACVSVCERKYPNVRSAIARKAVSQS